MRTEFVCPKCASVNVNRSDREAWLKAKAECEQQTQAVDKMKEKS
jgi:predicted RNA-binding Zn-ribbon protein involved in translation (DUF1610 family)